MILCQNFRGNESQKLAQIREAYTYMMVHPGLKMMAPGKNLSGEMATFIHDLNEVYYTDRHCL